MGIFISGYTQTVLVSDKTSGEPLSLVEISSDSLNVSVVTDVNGKANISTFRNIDKICFRMLGYKTLVISYTELAKNNFIVYLEKSEILLNEVVVSSYKDEETRQTSLHIEPLQLKEISKIGTFSLTDALSAVPGVSQLSTGTGISKPVIRGLFGNRILVLFSGLRFDNQQWQDEHGLGLSDIGISRVEIIKGPLSILYGTDAIGGVINIIEEMPPAKGTDESDFDMDFHSNTLGGTVQAGTKANYGNKWYRLRIATTNHCDYSDGNNSRVLNSRFNGYYLKGTFGFKKGAWQSDNHYHFSYNNFGFIFNDINHFMEPDRRWSRSMSGPHHIVMLNMFSSVNNIQLQKSVLKLNAGFQSNLRSEDEGGGQLSLIMHLVTGQYTLKWNKELGDNLFMVVANSSSLENNTNYGKRKIVPDAWMMESNLSAYLKYHLNKIIFEYGFGTGMRYIKTLLTKTVNSEEKDISPFQQTRPFFNGMLGASIIPNDFWTIKANLSTGVRAPNLAELSANGLHEGIYTYEIGDPKMKNEQNVNGDLGLYFNGKTIQFSTSGFYNYFNRYIYLDPTSEEWYGFPVYRYRQHHAAIYGNETVISVTPQFVSGLKVSASYSGLVGKLAGNEYLPYMPAQKIKPEIRYDHSGSNKTSVYGFVNTDFVTRQTRVNKMETETPAYQLLNAGVGMSCHSKKTEYTFNISANNLLNEAYYDHLSRLKNFGILNIGRDITANLKIKFINNIKKKNDENNF